MDQGPDTQEPRLDQGRSLDDVLETKVRLEAIISNAMDAIITVDADHRIIFFNPAAEQMFGISQEEALGQSINVFIPRRYRRAHDGHVRRLAETGVVNRRMGALGEVSALRADGEEFPVEASISQAFVGKERLSTVIVRDITERKASEEVRELLALEVDHRAKNALAIVQALVSLTEAPTPEAFQEAVTGRVSALARAHSLLAQNNWSGGPLMTVVQDEMAPYGQSGQVRYKGAALQLTPKAVQPLGLLIHELATNAVKYGALSTSTGLVEIEWSLTEANALRLTWRERNGPPVAPPQRKGFGSNLISDVTASQFGGKIELDWNPIGLEATAFLPGAVAGESEDGSRTRRPRAPREASGDNPKTALIVEDEVLVSTQMANALKQQGWRVLGPATSIQMAERLLSEFDKPDAAILDVNLSGDLVYPFARSLADAGVPIVFCTGYEALQRNTAFSQHPQLKKPVDMPTLVKTLHELIAQPAA